MKIKIVFILYALVILVAQKMIFSDALTIISDRYPVFIFIYPLIILSLPIGFDRPLSLLIAFFSGLVIDVFNDTLGMNAFALLVMTYLRKPVLRWIQPLPGYQTDDSSFRRYGMVWVLGYLGILFAVHIFSFYSIDAFTFVHIRRILICTALSILASLPFGFLILLLFKPR